MNNLKKSIMSVAMAAITAASPILSSYVAYASDITVNDDGTVTQISTHQLKAARAKQTKPNFYSLNLRQPEVRLYLMKVKTRNRESAWIKKWMVWSI